VAMAAARTIVRNMPGLHKSGSRCGAKLLTAQSLLSNNAYCSAHTLLHSYVNAPCMTAE
jgi:hypothetical protein